MSDYKSAIKRIQDAATLHELSRVEQGLAEACTNRATHSRRRGIPVTVIGCRRSVYVPQLGHYCPLWSIEP